MTAARVDYAYRYPFASHLQARDDGWDVRLATSGTRDGTETPFFFAAHLEEPRTAATMLLALSKVATSRFYLPRAMLNLDPVVTGNDTVMRFEAFSSCCGVYARADLEAGSFDRDIQGRGTTNVDFNGDMRSALARIRDADRVLLAVGAEEVRLSGSDGTVVEKKVSLPVRWLKGFAEVQAYQPRLRLHFDVPGPEARRFVRDLPRGGAPKQPSWVTPVGRGLRLSQRQTPGSVRIAGTDRLRLLEPLLALPAQTNVWFDEESGVSAWEVRYRSSRFTLLISPDIWRGFSGEGQILGHLAGNIPEEALPRVRAALRWESEVSVRDVSLKTGLSPEEVEAALAVLGARGLVGYDAGHSAYFQRELPFDMELVESLQPRLKDARRLLQDQKVQVISDEDSGEGKVELVVEGSEVRHRVVLSRDGDKCTCPWYSKHRGQRGPCKHVLAARMFVAPPDS